MESVVAWTDHKILFQSGLKTLHETGKFSDLTIKCRQKVFKVHKLVIGMFTDYFSAFDGLWMRMDVNETVLESIIKFIYLGQVTLNYNLIESFLSTCKILNIKLFKPSEPENGSDSSNNLFQDRYELNDFQLLCRNCYKCFPHDVTMKKHRWACTKERSFKCNLCDKSYRFKSELETHIKAHTSEFPFVCTWDGCTKRFHKQNFLKKHIRFQHEKRGVTCPECGRVFAGFTQKKIHMAEEHGHDKPFSCSQCPVSFVTRSLLNSHVRSFHGKNKGHAEFKVRHDKVDVVIKIDPKSKLYCCPWKGCEDQFQVKSAVVKHYRSVHEKKRVKCPECDKEYTTGTSMRYHMSRVHGLEKPFVCQECGEAFVIKSLLVTHFKKVHELNFKTKVKKKRKRHEVDHDKEI